MNVSYVMYIVFVPVKIVLVCFKILFRYIYCYICCVDYFCYYRWCGCHAVYIILQLGGSFSYVGRYKIKRLYRFNSLSCIFRARTIIPVWNAIGSFMGFVRGSFLFCYMCQESIGILSSISLYIRARNGIVSNT